MSTRSKNIFAIILLDALLSLLGLIVCAPILIVFCILIWLNDYHSPFYVSSRIGKNGKIFKMFKLRSMIINADQHAIDNTSISDSRITKIGHIVRKYKIDEIPQFINVLKGDMHLVGPRPDVPRSVNLYTSQEKKLLTVKPGITDIASIVFSDTGNILHRSRNPDLDYHRLIRPWKSHLALFYADNQSFGLDINLIYLTVLLFFSRRLALQKVNQLLVKLEAPIDLRRVAMRQEELQPAPPPGATEIVNSY
jgi:lipopolysaccharide/colanic/teichoic acid biosynthesis glycosyltransferase